MTTGISGPPSTVETPQNNQPRNKMSNVKQIKTRRVGNVAALEIETEECDHAPVYLDKDQCKRLAANLLAYAQDIETTAYEDSDLGHVVRLTEAKLADLDEPDRETEAQLRSAEKMLRNLINDYHDLSIRCGAAERQLEHAPNLAH